MKMAKFLWVFPVGIFAAVLAFAGGGGGGEVPSPFGLANQHLELADGELYSLIGRIVTLPAVENISGEGVFSNDGNTSLPIYPALNEMRMASAGPGVGGGVLQPYFEVDLATQPWLNNERRNQNPFYPIEGAPDWAKYVGQRVKVKVLAHGVIIMTPKPHYVITLKPISDSQVEILSTTTTGSSVSGPAAGGDVPLLPEQGSLIGD